VYKSNFSLVMLLRHFFSSGSILGLLTVLIFPGVAWAEFGCQSGGAAWAAGFSYPGPSASHAAGVAYMSSRTDLGGLVGDTLSCSKQLNNNAQCNQSAQPFYTLCMESFTTRYGGTANVAFRCCFTGSCSAGKKPDFSTGKCDGSPKNSGAPPAQSCVGNPVNAGTGNKIQRETDFSQGRGVEFERVFNGDGLFRPSRIGVGWIDNYHLAISVVSTIPEVVSAIRGDGKIYDFTWTGTAWSSDADVKDQLSKMVDGVGALVGWEYRKGGPDSVETYDSAGRLISIRSRSSIVQSLHYSDGTSSSNGGYVLDASGNSTSVILPAGLLLYVEDSFGRKLTFGYDSLNLIVRITSSQGDAYRYQFDNAGNLISVTYPGGETRSYAYNESVNTSGADLPNALTGIIDENNQRFSTYKYDASGRAISTEHAGGAEKVSIAYSTDANGNVISSAITDALNTTRTYSFTNILGVVKNIGVSQPCSSCGGSAANALTYDANGNIASRTDFNGNKTTYIYDLTRNLPSPPLGTRPTGYH
jgi:YD repeat-containing protein